MCLKLEPVKLTLLKDFINRGKNRHCVIKRYSGSSDLFSKKGVNNFWIQAKRYLGLPYDYYFQWSDKRIYCSELVWKIYKDTFNIDLCGFNKYKDFDLSKDPVKKILIKRFGSLDKVPLNEPVIPPDLLFNSIKLKTISSIN
jgi:hypothetical protein